MNERGKAIKALSVSTVAFTACFACWILNAVLIIYLVSSEAYAFSETQVGTLLAVPILTGAVSRVPLGLMTDRYGGRTVFSVLLVVVAVPMYLLSFADSFTEFLVASLAFGLAGGSFAVGVGYVSVWFDKNRQGTALGIFGIGNAGAALTTMFAPLLLIWFTDAGQNVEGWRLLPKVYAVMLLVIAIAFYLVTDNRVALGNGSKSLGERLAPLRSIVVWRLGLYYFLVFGGFVTLAQWIVPYSVNVYEISVAEAGFLASAFSLPSGVVRAAGGWLSDRFGARSVMYWVFGSCILASLLLSVPKFDLYSPGEGILAKNPGIVASVSPDKIIVGDKEYLAKPPPDLTPAKQDDGTAFLPQFESWHISVVSKNSTVRKKQLLARGVTNIYYPAHLWFFAFLVFVIGVATGIGMAGVYRIIPDQFPNSVGAVGGVVGLLGALGGFVLPPIFSGLLQWTGIWTTCWIVFLVISLACLIWLHLVGRNIMQEEAPELIQLMEHSPVSSLDSPISPENEDDILTMEDLLKRIPFFSDLSREELSALVEIGAKRSISEDEVVFAEGDPGYTFYMILSGAVKIHRISEEGTEIELASLRSGEFFGELALIDGKPRSASATTLVPCEFFSIERREFLTQLSKSPRLIGHLLVNLSTKIRQTNKKAFEQLLNNQKIQSDMEIERLRSISTMVVGVAHEINTPIGIANHAASVIGENLNSLSNENVAPDRVQSMLRDVKDASSLVQANIARADKLIQTFKHLSVSQISDSKETIDLRELTESAIDLYRMKAKASGLEIVTVDELGDGAAMWDGYPGHYSQILLNLLTNIERYAYPAGKGGRAELTLSSVGGKEPRYIVEVRDFGSGMSKDDAERGFEPFFTTGRAQGGTGLGLAIVKNLVTGSLQGKVNLDSEPGSGTRITMSFPQIIIDDTRER